MCWAYTAAHITRAVGSFHNLEVGGSNPSSGKCRMLSYPWAKHFILCPYECFVWMVDGSKGSWHKVAASLLSVCHRAGGTKNIAYHQRMEWKEWIQCSAFKNLSRQDCKAQYQCNVLLVFYFTRINEYKNSIIIVMWLIWFRKIINSTNFKALLSGKFSNQVLTSGKCGEWSTAGNIWIVCKLNPWSRITHSEKCHVSG